MKKITKYIAFDGKEFDLQTECEEYEKEGFVQEIENVKIRLQQLKSGELHFEHDRYVKARAKYLRACVEKMRLDEKASITINYVSTKQRYNNSVTYYYKLKNKLKLMLKKLEEANVTSTENAESSN